MDKSSPVFENFENKMAAMTGRPKINRSTFKIGSGGLQTRVANNEKKITTLKNIFKAQRIQIGEKLTPKVNILEESLIKTNAIITDVASQLERDFSDRLQEQKDLLAKEKRSKLDDKRDSKEARIETKKIGKFLGSTADQITKPFKSIFQKIFDFGRLFLMGVGVNGALTWLTDPKNLGSMLNFLEKLKERPLISLIALGGSMYIFTEAISVFKKGLFKVIFTLLNPMTYVDLFTGKTFRNFLPKMQKLVNRAGNRTTKGFLLKKVAQQGLKKGGPKILGALPLIGNFIDIGAAIYRFSKGDIVGGFLSLGSAIPVLGWGIAAIDIAREFGAFEGSILEKKKTESRAIGGDVTAGTYYKTNDGPDGATEYFKPHMAGTILTPIQAEREIGRVQRRRRRKPTITEINMPDKVIDNRTVTNQVEPGDSSTLAHIVDYSPFNENDPHPREFYANAGLGDLA